MRGEYTMSQIELNKIEKNKELVLEAFDTLFNQHDYIAAEHYWSPKYIQHSAHIPPGREGLFNLVKSIPLTLKYEPGTIVADGDFVMVHGRNSGRALGCDPRRSYPGAVKERPSHVRGQVSECLGENEIGL